MWRWVAGIVLAVAAIITVSRSQHYATEKYEDEREKACISLSVSPEEKHSCKREALGRHDYSPWWYVLVAWPGGIMAWATIATGAAIAWQSLETRKSAEAARTQLRMATARDRATLKIEAKKIDALSRGTEQWVIIADVSVKNVGIGRAYILHASGELKLRFARETPKLCITSKSSNQIGLADKAIQATSEFTQPIPYQGGVQTLDEVADPIYAGSLVPYVFWGRRIRDCWGGV